MKKEFPDYILNPEHVARVSGASDLFFDKFDTTWMFGKEDTKERVFSVIPIEGMHQDEFIDDGEVEYVYNNEWFRCDDFTEKNNSKYHIVFSGCSETEGVGSPLETVWANIVYSNLKEKYDISGYYSLGKSGNGWHKIVSSFLLYIKKYGKPTHFFVLLPNIGRDYVWKEGRGGWAYDQTLTFSVDRESLPEDMLKKVITPEQHKKSFIDFTLGWKLFEEFCKASDIKLVCTTWDLNENPNLTMVNQHKSFFPLDYKKFSEYVMDARPNGKFEKRDMRRRDNHSGVLFHEWWAKEFLNQIEYREFFND